MVTLLVGALPVLEVNNLLGRGRPAVRTPLASPNMGRRELVLLLLLFLRSGKTERFFSVNHYLLLPGKVLKTERDDGFLSRSFNLAFDF